MNQLVEVEKDAIGGASPAKITLCVSTSSELRPGIPLKIALTLGVDQGNVLVRKKYEFWPNSS